MSSRQRAILGRYAAQERANQRARLRRAQEGRVAINLRKLLREQPNGWGDGRLNIWCRDAPILLLAALTIGGHEPSQAGLPRDRGAYNAGEMHEVLHYSVLAELEADARAWRAFGRWCLTRLYPAWRARNGRPHACEARVYWCGRTHSETADRLLGYHDTTQETV